MSATKALFLLLSTTLFANEAPAQDDLEMRTEARSQALEELPRAWNRSAAESGDPLFSWAWIVSADASQRPKWSATAPTGVVKLFSRIENCRFVSQLRRKMKVQGLFSGFPVNQILAASELPDTERLQIVEEIVQTRLGEIQRHVLRERFWKGKTLREIAENPGNPLRNKPAVDRALKSALKDVQQILGSKAAGHEFSICHVVDRVRKREKRNRILGCLPGERGRLKAGKKQGRSVRR